MTSRFAVQSTSSPVIERVSGKLRSRKMGFKPTIAGNGNRVGSDSYGEEGKDLGEEVHDVVDVKGDVRGMRRWWRRKWGLVTTYLNNSWAVTQERL